MDFCRNISVSGGVPSESQSEQPLPSSSCSNKLGTLDELFLNHNTAEGDVSLEWLSVFVEDCFSNRGNHCLPPAAAAEAPTTNELQKKKTSSVDIIAAASKPQQQQQQQNRSTSSSLQKFVIPVKARSKRRRGPIIKSKTQVSSSCWSHMTCSSDPPLLQQAYWLADSELILPKKEDSMSTTTTSSRDRDGGCGGEREGKDEKEVKEEAMVVVVVGGGGKDKRGGRRLELEDERGSNANIGGRQQQQQQQARRCSHCLAQRTPQWRAGPLGPKTLCNACGVRFKSGRLLPEYRPAKSPTFVSCMHSNSHKKVLEMRQSSMALRLPSSSIPTHQY